MAKRLFASATLSDRRSGGQDVAVVFATRIGVVLLGVLVQAMLARMLLPDGRGAYAVCLVFATMLGMVCTPGAQQGAQQFVMTRQTSVSQAVSCALAICVVGGGLAVALSLPLLGSEIAYFEKADRSSFHIALALLPIIAFALAMEHQLAALRRFGRLASASLLRMVANVVAIAVLVWMCDLGVYGALWALIGANAVMIVVCMWDLRRHCGLVFRLPETLHMARILGYGMRYHVARVGDGLGPFVGILLLGLLATDTQIGLFAVASTLMLGFLVISNSVGNALLPRIALGDSPAPSPADAETPAAGRPELVAACLRVVWVVTALALVATLAAGAPLVRLLFSEAFLPSLPLLWIMAPGMLAGACAGMFMTYFKAVNRPQVCSWTYLLGLGVDIGALLLLFGWLGTAAAAWALTLGMVSRCALLAFAFRKATGLGWRGSWLPGRDDIAFVLDAARSLRPSAGAASPR